MQGVYLFGIIHALRESDRVIFDQWISSPRIADIICTSIIVAPYITNEPCSLAAGISAYFGKTKQANDFAQALYLVWSTHCVALSSMTLFAGWRLIRILNTHIQRKEESKANIDTSKIKLGVSKVKIIAYTSTICMILYLGVAILYGTFRVQIITHIPYSIFLCIAWNGLGILASMLVSFAVMLNPRMKLSLLFSSNSSEAIRTQEFDLGTTGTFITSITKVSNNMNKGYYNNNGISTITSENATPLDSIYDAQTFDSQMMHGNKFVHKDVMYKGDSTPEYPPVGIAPTLSTAIAMKYSNQDNPLVLQDNDAELIHAYPESIKSCSLLVDEKHPTQH
ncbi:hypothetical protein BC941DRAFT_91553 [Chlamydoabsidia padenii]|nr:hypothetical protein BC941DRAFT_91553 [Chlamydoabsidia padenii]